MPHPLSEQLAKEFINTFWSADHSIKWLGSEVEHSMWLDKQTMLVGRIDGLGINELNKPFFAEFKTLNAWSKNRMETVKLEWRMNPQSLTYGVLVEDLRPGTRDFTVRWALKTKPPVCHYEWYTYSTAEIQWWRSELLKYADRIRQLRKTNGNWPTNFNRCLKYGEKYVCDFFHDGCAKLNFDFIPIDAIARESHLDVERKFHAQQGPIKADTPIVVLDATRIEDFIDCNELYRKRWESGDKGTGLRSPAGESLVIGTDFHALVGAHIKSLITKETKTCTAATA